MTFVTHREVFQWQRLFTYLKPTAGTTTPASHKLALNVLGWKEAMPEVF